MKKYQLENLVTAITKTLLEELRKEETSSGAVAPVTGTHIPIQKRIMEGGQTIYKTREGGSDVYWMDNKDTGGKTYIKPESLNKYRSQGYEIIDINSGEELTEGNEDTIPGTFVDRGQVRLQGGIDQALADKIAHHWWDVMQSTGKDERGVYNYKTRGDAWCCSVGLLNGRPAILSSTTTSGRLNLLVGNDEIFGASQLSETSITGGANGEAYNIPAAFSRRDGGSRQALEGSNKLGYELTPLGKKDMSRHPDRMIE